MSVDLSEKLVQRVNELHFDYLREKYRPIEIFDFEVDRWKRITKQFLDTLNSKIIVDIGTGTGFVPLTIADLLDKDSIFICSDISQQILEVAEKNIKKKNFQCRFEFIKIESQVPFRLPFNSNYADVITINSVLHNIKEPNTFLNEIDRILKPNGIIFIGHEPNKYFHENRFLKYNYLILNSLINPKFLLTKIGEKIHLIKLFKLIYHFINKERGREYANYSAACQEINKILLKEGLINRPLTLEEINKIVDIKAEEGFKFDLLFPDYKLLYFETYNHLSWVYLEHHKNFFIQRYEKYLSKKFPKYGSNFFIVLKKSYLGQTIKIDKS
jgi:ubiquinone/menaquinone biosynthesis C-methylase UbiE